MPYHAAVANTMEPIMTKPSQDLTQPQASPARGGFMPSMAVLLLLSLFASWFLAYGVYRLLDRFYPEDASVALVQVVDHDGDADPHQTGQLAGQLASPALQEAMARNLLGIRPEWFTHDSVDEVAQRLAHGLQWQVMPEQQSVSLAFVGGPPLRVQHVLEAVILTLEQEVARTNGVLRVRESPSEPLRIAPRMVPLVPVLMVFFLPILPGLVLLERWLFRGGGQGVSA